MPATWTTWQPALKDVWTQQEFEAQIYDEHPLLDELEKTDKYTIGENALVPLWTNRNGGFTVANTSGSSALNPAGNVGIDQASYGLAFNYQQVKVEHAAIAVSMGTDNSVGSAGRQAAVLDTEFEGATSTMRTQITRQAYQDQTALITACGTTSSSTTVNLATTAGYDALVRGWLDETLTVDIGTTGSETSVAADREITAVGLSSTTPTITISGAAVTTASTDYISIANARSGATSKEMNGLGNIISTSAALGGISAGGRWQAATVDSSTTDLTLSAMLTVQEHIMQNAGAGKNRAKCTVLTSYKQGRRFYELFQNQVRFVSGDQVKAGNTEDIEWNGMRIRQDADCPSTKMFFYKPEHLLIVTSPLGMHWANELTGGKRIEWAQNTTGFVGLLAYPINLCANRRNVMGALTALT